MKPKRHAALGHRSARGRVRSETLRVHGLQIRTSGLTRIFHRQACGADFQVCCNAGFRTRGRRAFSTPGRFGNRRYGRFGNLRYARLARVGQSSHEKSGLECASPLALFQGAPESKSV